MVRSYILTVREREIIRKFLNEATKLNGFSVLKGQLKRWSKATVIEDLDLIEAFLKLA